MRNHHRNCGRSVIYSLFLNSMFAATLLAATSNEWTSWRGPHGNGSIEAGSFPTRWDGTNVQWKVELPGKGTSTPVVYNDRIYLTSPSEGQDAVIAFDFSGKQVWQTKLGPEDPPKHRSLASSCNASPVTDGKGLFVYFKSGNLAAIEFDGKKRWQINIVEKFGKENLFWDQGASPVVTEHHVVIARMHSGESWIAAFDKNTGKMSWKQSRNFKVPTENDNGYATPLLFQHEAKKALLLWGADHLTAYNANDGKLLWTCGDFNPDGTGFWPGIATPVIAGNVAVVPVGRDDRAGQARVHGIRLNGSGIVTDTHRAWKREDTGVFVATPVEYKGRVYLLRHRGEIVCLDPASGKTLWTGTLPEHRSPYYSSPVIANGILFAAREDGVVYAAKVEEKFELLGENPMGERIIAAPVPVKNSLLIRGDKHLYYITKNSR